MDEIVPPVVPLSSPDQLSDNKDSSGITRTQSLWLLARLQTALRLSDMSTKCLDLTYNDLQSPDQIASTLGITVSQVRTRLKDSLYTIEFRLDILQRDNKDLYDWVVSDILNLEESEDRIGGAESDISTTSLMNKKSDSDADKDPDKIHIYQLAQTVGLTSLQQNTLFFFVKGLSYQEIASELNTACGNISQRMVYIRKKIKRHIRARRPLDVDLRIWTQERILAARKKKGSVVIK